MRVWLLTWEGPNVESKKPQRIVALLSPDKSPRMVLEFTEQLYLRETATVSERRLYIEEPTRNPYPARFTNEGTAVNCGHNPYLVARIVEDFEVRNEAGVEKAQWTEPDGQRKGI